MKKNSLITVALLLILAATLLFSSCNETPDPSGTNDTTPAPGDTTVFDDSGIGSEPVVDDGSQLMVVAGGKTDFKIIRPDKCSEELTNATSRLRKSITEHYDIRMTFDTDWTKAETPIVNDNFEILIGNTDLGVG